MNVCEIFTSIQGESSFAGLPCTFIRLSGCNLRCSYCDTKYSYDRGRDMTIDEIVAEATAAATELVEVTGGEPLLQKETPELIRRLLDKGHRVLLETNGSLSLEDVDRRATVILDVKTPASGMADTNHPGVFDLLKPSDEIKFVLCSREDYDWAKALLRGKDLSSTCTVLFSAAAGKLDPADLAKWIVADRLPVRLNLQIHKYIFGPEARGV